MKTTSILKRKTVLVLIIIFMFFVLIPFYFIYHLTGIVEIRTKNLITPRIELDNGDTIYVYRELRNKTE